MSGRARDRILKPGDHTDMTEVIRDGGYDGMQTFDQALYAHVQAGRVTVEDAMDAATSPHDFKLLLEAEGRRGTTMDDVPMHAQEEDEEEPQAPARHELYAAMMADATREDDDGSPSGDPRSGLAGDVPDAV